MGELPEDEGQDENEPIIVLTAPPDPIVVVDDEPDEPGV